jgi:hypothetical protein
MVLSKFKITNLKRQITNKSQIAIPNDPNMHRSSIVSIPPDLNSGGSDVWNFEFGSLEFICDLVFGA